MPLLCYEWSLNIRLSTPLTFSTLVPSHSPQVCWTIDDKTRLMIHNDIKQQNWQNRPPNRAGRAGYTWCTGELCSWGSEEPPLQAPRELEGKTFKLVEFCSGETEIWLRHPQSTHKPSLLRDCLTAWFKLVFLSSNFLFVYEGPKRTEKNIVHLCWIWLWLGSLNELTDSLRAWLLTVRLMYPMPWKRIKGDEIRMIDHVQDHLWTTMRRRSWTRTQTPR